MRQSLQTRFREVLISGLKRKSATTCSEWARRYRVDPEGKLWSYKFHPWTKEISDFNGDWVSQKAAQMGLTEVALNRVFFNLDILQRDCLYILPKKNPDASDFSAARFDPALESSPHLKMLFDEVNNVGHKRAGLRNLYIRGAQSASGLKSIPAPVLAWDELDEMPKFAISLGRERMSGKRPEDTQDFKLSTPTIPNFGINEEFKYSSQDHYFFRCPRCSKLTELVYPDCLVITADDIRSPKLKDSHLICKECKGILNHLDKPNFLAYDKCQWVPAQTDSNVRGFLINQLYSCMLPPWKIAEAAIKAQYDSFQEKELHRSKLAMPFVPKGARVLPDDIERALKNYRNGEYRPTSIVTMGVDQGKWLHYEINEWFIPQGVTPDINARALSRVVKQGKCASFEELDQLMRNYPIRMVVIDAQPERRKAYEFAQRHTGRVFLCFFNRGINGKQMSVDNTLRTIAVDRTSWLDVALGRFMAGSIDIPMNTDNEYKTHIQALVKETSEDDSGNLVSRYVSVDEDHYGLARCYAEMTLPLVVTAGSGHENIKDVL